MNLRTKMILPLMLAAVCAAQDDNKPQKPSKPEPPIVTMSFGGGTMADFVAAVRRAEPKSNIVVQSAAAAAKVPAMELKAAGLDQVLDSACAVATVATNQSRIQCAEQRGNGEPVFAIVSRPTGMQSAGPNYDQVETIVLSLNRLTEGDARHEVPGLKVETILSAIEAGGNIDKDKAPTLRYHEDSGLLFLRGTRRQVSLASEVLKMLERDQSQRAKNTPRPTNNAGGGGQTPKNGR